MASDWTPVDGVGVSVGGLELASAEALTMRVASNQWLLMIGVLVLLTTEVAANAIVHTGTDATAVVSYLGPHIRVGVRDGGATSPSVVVASQDETSGRGLALVELLASAWGTSMLQTGKEVWFELPVGAGPLPAP